MRFVHVNHRYAPFAGGSERWMQEASEVLARAGHDVTVVTTNAFDLEYMWDRKRECVHAPRNECLNGVNVERVPITHLPLSSLGFQGSRRVMGELSRMPLPAWPFRAISRLQPFVPSFDAAVERGLPADLVHATNVGIESLALRAMRIARAHGARFVLTPFIHLGVDGDPVARRYVSMPHQLELIRSADAVMVMTEAEGEFVRQIRGGHGDIVVTGAGVDIDEVTHGKPERLRQHVSSRGFVVGSIGALAQDKGTFDLARAVIDLRRSGHEIELLLVGPPLRSFVRWYTDLSDTEREGIHVLGFVSAAFKRDVLAAIDVMALPSRTESFGIVYLEAWANRVPVIAADTPATRELVGTSGGGLLTPFGDIEAIAGALLSMMRSPETRKAMGAAGFEMTCQRHTWEHVVRRVAHVYADVLDVEVLG